MFRKLDRNELNVKAQRKCVHWVAEILFLTIKFVNGQMFSGIYFEVLISLVVKALVVFL